MMLQERAAVLDLTSGAHLLWAASEFKAYLGMSEMSCEASR